MYRQADSTKQKRYRLLTDNLEQSRAEQLTDAKEEYASRCISSQKAVGGLAELDCAWVADVEVTTWLATALCTCQPLYTFWFST